MVHLPALPGSPMYAGSFDRVLDAAAADATALAEGGADAIMMENFFDVPFFKDGVPPSTIASMTAAAGRVKEAAPDLPIGINVLRNDGRAAIAIAAAVGAEFVRINVLTAARVTDQGIIEGDAANVLRDRAMLRADHVQIWADVDVKHSAPLAKRPMAEEIADTLHRGRASALIVSGGGTGQATDADHVRDVVEASGTAPVFIGSGATAETVGDFPGAAGFIVGTSLKDTPHLPTGRVRADKVAAFRDALS